MSHKSELTARDLDIITYLYGQCRLGVARTALEICNELHEMCRERWPKRNAPIHVELARLSSLGYVSNRHMDGRWKYEITLEGISLVEASSA